MAYGFLNNRTMPSYGFGLLDQTPSVASTPSIADYLANYQQRNEEFRVKPFSFGSYGELPENPPSIISEPSPTLQSPYLDGLSDRPRDVGGDGLDMGRATAESAPSAPSAPTVSSVESDLAKAAQAPDLGVLGVDMNALAKSLGVQGLLDTVSEETGLKDLMGPDEANVNAVMGPDDYATGYDVGTGVSALLSTPLGAAIVGVTGVNERNALNQQRATYGLPNISLLDAIMHGVNPFTSMREQTYKDIMDLARNVNTMTDPERTRRDQMAQMRALREQEVQAAIAKAAAEREAAMATAEAYGGGGPGLGHAGMSGDPGNTSGGYGGDMGMGPGGGGKEGGGATW